MNVIFIPVNIIYVPVNVIFFSDGEKENERRNKHEGRTKYLGLAPKRNMGLGTGLMSVLHQNGRKRRKDSEGKEGQVMEGRQEREGRQEQKEYT